MVLASTSPRRRDLIGALDIEVLFADPGVAEGGAAKRGESGGLRSASLDGEGPQRVRVGPVGGDRRR